ncbi:MAG: hypothetical protein APF81_20160 [Desulfosporosinus sp. BRH_c37]|nr:MAG: hypothetical protein APF81_20160 [Desulfosporosinus sp. BRH_c37]
MAKENVKKFYEAVVADEGLRTRLNELDKQYQGEAKDEKKRVMLAEKLVLPIAAEIGFSFTMEELRQYEEEMVQASANRQLDNNELEAVAGGAAAGVGYCSGLGLLGIIGIGTICVIVGFDI